MRGKIILIAAALCLAVALAQASEAPALRLEKEAVSVPGAYAYDLAVCNESDAVLERIFLTAQSPEGLSGGFVSADSDNVTLQADGTAVIRTLPSGQTIRVRYLCAVPEGQADFAEADTAATAVMRYDDPADGRCYEILDVTDGLVAVARETRAATLTELAPATATPAVTPDATGTPASVLSPTPAPTPVQGLAESGGVRLTVTSDPTEAQAGETVTLRVSIDNLTDHTLDEMTLTNRGLRTETQMNRGQWETGAFDPVSQDVIRLISLGAGGHAEAEWTGVMPEGGDARLSVGLGWTDNGTQGVLAAGLKIPALAGAMADDAEALPGATSMAADRAQKLMAVLGCGAAALALAAGIRARRTHKRKGGGRS